MIVNRVQPIYLVAIVLLLAISRLLPHPPNAVPITAISSDAEGKYVWLVADDSMTVSRQRVEVSDGIGEMLVVHSGLQAGDTIISAGGGFLAEGMQVRRWEDQTDHLN